VVRVGLIGVGHWHAAIHLGAARSAGAEVAAAWDAHGPTAEAFAMRHDAPLAATPDEVAARSDLLVVMGRPDTVPPLAELVAAKGLPMILEKPAAPDGEGLAALARRIAPDRFVAVPFPNRLGPAMQEYRRLAATGRAGGIGHAAFRIVNGPPRRYRDDGVPWMLDPALSGGGALRNLGIHGIDSALALAMGPVRLASAHIGLRIHRGETIEDHALVTLEDATGALFTVEAGYTFASLSPGGDFEWRIATANAYLVDRGDAASAATLDDAQEVALTPLPPSERYAAFMADTLSRLSSSRPPAVGLADYVRAMEVIDQAYAPASA
jgi:predicted dehydrogenase